MTMEQIIGLAFFPVMPLFIVSAINRLLAKRRRARHEKQQRLARTAAADYDFWFTDFDDHTDNHHHDSCSND
jgi:hypothetical protein